MVLDRTAFIERVQARLGSDTSDDAMTFIEDMTDTYNELESKSKDNTDWKEKYNELDKSWREKYKARFNSPSTSPDEIIQSQKDDVIDDGSNKTFDDLFTEREG